MNENGIQRGNMHKLDKNGNRRRYGRHGNKNTGAPRGKRTGVPAHGVTGREKAVKLGLLPEPRGAFAALIPPLQRAVHEEGYVTPSPIQKEAIPHLLNRRDLFGCAQTGTGKTAAFVLPTLQYFTLHRRVVQRGRPRALILAPTRELAAQIGESIKAYGRHLSFGHVVIFGGVSQVPQVKKLRRGVEFIVATPGRLLDLMQQGYVKLDGIEIFVLDEADRMLDMGFLPDLRKIIDKLPKKRQSLFFSATLGDDILDLARGLVRDPVHVTITPEQPAVERIVQKVMFVEKSDKDRLLCSILKDTAADKVLVFTDMKHVANKVSRKLTASGIPSSAIHGDKSQAARTEALAGFKKGKVRVLVATDIAARGIDVTGITHVINYCLPNEAGTYVHRIGRTARAEADGIAVSFCSPRERDYLRDIERLLKKRVPADVSHEFHSEAARVAVGSDARPVPKGNRGRAKKHAVAARRSAPRRGTRTHRGKRQPAPPSHHSASALPSPRRGAPGPLRGSNPIRP